MPSFASRLGPSRGIQDSMFARRPEIATPSAIAGPSRPIPVVTPVPRQHPIAGPSSVSYQASQMAQNNAATEPLATTGLAPPQTSLPTIGVPHAATRPTPSGLDMQELKKALPVAKDLPAPMIYPREVDIYQGKVYPKESSKPSEDLRVWNTR